MSNKHEIEEMLDAIEDDGFHASLTEGYFYIDNPSDEAMRKIDEAAHKANLWMTILEDSISDEARKCGLEEKLMCFGW